MTDEGFQKVVMVALGVRGWETRAKTRGANLAGWVTHYQPDFREKGQFLIPLEVLKTGGCTLVFVGGDHGAIGLAVNHLRDGLKTHQLKMRDGFLVVPLDLAVRYAVLTLRFDVDAS